MGLLGVLRLGAVAARRGGEVALAVFLADDATGIGDGLRRHVDAVGPHVGDKTHRLAADLDTLVELLRGAHGLGGSEAELARGLLLERRGGEGRGGVALGGLRLHAADLERGEFEVALERSGVLAVADVETLDALAVGTDETRLEHRALLGHQGRDQRPVFAGLERLDFALALADEAQGHGLDAAG